MLRETANAILKSDGTIDVQVSNGRHDTINNIESLPEKGHPELDRSVRKLLNSKGMLKNDEMLSIIDNRKESLAESFAKDFNLFYR